MNSSPSLPTIDSTFTKQRHRVHRSQEPLTLIRELTEQVNVVKEATSILIQDQDRDQKTNALVQEILFKEHQRRQQVDVNVQKLMTSIENISHRLEIVEKFLYEKFHPSMQPQIPINQSLNCVHNQPPFTFTSQFIVAQPLGYRNPAKTDHSIAQ